MPELAFTRLAGPPGGSALLVVGPSLGTAVTPLWRACASVLAQADPGLTVVGWDLPGHGESPPAPAFSIAELASAVRSRTEELVTGLTTGLTTGGTALYAGVSLGGAVGQQLALDPGPFTAVAAVASAPRFGEPAGWHERAELVRRAGTPVMVGPSSQRWFAPGFTDRAPEAAGALLSSLAEADSASYAAACLALAEFDLVDRLEEARIPILLAPGEHDQVIIPAHVLPWGELPGVSVTTIPGAGHLPPAEVPEPTCQILTDFFAEDR